MIVTGNEELSAAEKLQFQAEQVIEKLKIRQQWGKVGKTILVGSANFGLMTAPNLDFEIYVETPDIRIGFDTIREFATIPRVQKIEFLNLMKTQDPGLYWRIDYQDQDGVLWDIDNWLVPLSHPHAGMAERFANAMKRVLTDESKRTILAIKSAMKPEKKYRGIDVYKAVLSGGVRDYAQFLQWMAEHPPVEMETWYPSV